ncbi:hypothetical protein Rrhod_0942 [Rhodococcus rhodnii LMG 5362]|uniref:Uncharacterized protein n=1 Tax=Rhodococcus rhodnii LMG 5362 TaxID=1273125 RepID=R7WQU8_9NOCA|nr:hypothetical protein Rrhod_0942 [Rhodococcus rhodnii LMG 5362]
MALVAAWSPDWSHGATVSESRPPHAPAAQKVGESGSVS